jgi:hypothetical protein
MEGHLVEIELRETIDRSERDERRSIIVLFLLARDECCLRAL